MAAAIDDANRRGDTEWSVSGYLNDTLHVGDDLEGHPILGGLDEVLEFVDRGYYFIDTIYRGSDGKKASVFPEQIMRIPENCFATFVHPWSYIAGNVEIGQGTVIMPGVCISPGVKIGKCCAVLMNAAIGHNTEIGDYCRCNAKSCLGSGLQLGRGTIVGLNASIRENITTGECSILGMGSVLLSDMGPYEVWAGVPAKKIRVREH